jgi:hypothetical protein
MKYISVLILLALLGWTWSMATSERAFSLEEHKRVEAGVEDDIRGFIQRKFPETKEIFCQQLYTEVIDPGVELIARFRCQAVGESSPTEATEQVFEGHIRLRSKDGFATWSEVGGEIRSPQIRFLKGIKVTPEGEKS